MTELAPLLLPLFLLVASALGWQLQRALPERHRSRESVEAVRLVLGMLVTFAALVLGLLVSSSKSHFDDHAALLRAYSIDLIEADLRLREYGTPADAARGVLRAYTAAAIADTWPGERPPQGAYPLRLHSIRPGSVESLTLGGMLLDADRMVDTLDPATPLQRALQPVLAARMQSILQHRWLLVGSAQPTLSWPVLAVMTGWLILVFAIFGLSAPANPVLYSVIALAALSLSMALWLIMELDSPLTGLVHVSSEPMREALLHMDLPPGQPP